MEILYLLIPLSVLLIMALIALLAWALQGGQFDDLEHQGELIFDPEEAAQRAQALRRNEATPMTTKKPYKADQSGPT